MDVIETRTDSADLTFERFKGALEGKGSYPGNAIFVDAEAEYAGRAVVRNMREGLPVVLIYPDGVEKVVQPITESGASSILSKARGLSRRLLTVF
jgi:hypothetical protein